MCSGSGGPRASARAFADRPNPAVIRRWSPAAHGAPRPPTAFSGCRISVCISPSLGAPRVLRKRRGPSTCPRIHRSPTAASDSPVASGCTRRPPATHGVTIRPYSTISRPVSSGPWVLPHRAPRFRPAGDHTRRSAAMMRLAAQGRRGLAGGLRLHTARHGRPRRSLDAVSPSVYRRL